jgi:hypothetical protein
VIQRTCQNIILYGFEFRSQARFRSVRLAINHSGPVLAGVSRRTIDEIVVQKGK